MTDPTTIIVDHHRRRRFAMKVQQKLDRALESFLRANFTAWSPDLGDAERDKFNAQVTAMIKAARDGTGNPDVVELVKALDQSREPFDAIRATAEKAMEKLAKQLPVYPWLETVRGAGALGLATIIAEAGDLSRYPNPAKLWRRLGFAPFDGHAGSTWKRQTWRPRTLTADEWIDNPFSGQRYALMHQVGVWLVNAQWIGAAKSDTGQGKPNGPYGEVYAKRRAHTALTHPDWSKQHSRMDALRITMKSFLLDLWTQWNRTARTDVKPIAHVPSVAAGQRSSDAQHVPARRTKRERPKVSDDHGAFALATDAARCGLKPRGAMRRRHPSKRTASRALMPNAKVPSARAAGHSHGDSARRTLIDRDAHQ